MSPLPGGPGSPLGSCEFLTRSGMLIEEARRVDMGVALLAASCSKMMYCWYSVSMSCDVLSLDVSWMVDSRIVLKCSQLVLQLRSLGCGCRRGIDVLTVAMTGV
jgi:hypothetical protein